MGIMTMTMTIENTILKGKNMHNDTRISEFLLVVESDKVDEETKKMALKALKKYLESCI